MHRFLEFVDDPTVPNIRILIPLRPKQKLLALVKALFLNLAKHLELRSCTRRTRRAQAYAHFPQPAVGSLVARSMLSVAASAREN